MKNFKIATYITLISGILFSLLSIHFKADISIIAFPLSAGFTALVIWSLFFKLLKDNQKKFAGVSLKLLQYYPYVLLFAFILRRAGKTETLYAYDVITVILWCIAMIGRWILIYRLNPKRIEKLNPEWVNKPENTKGSGMIAVKKVSKKGALFEFLDWIDAICQAVLMVFLFQIFVLQLYVIPSESMVPSFLIKDRVVVFKTTSGPKFPLSDVGVPCLKKYKKGDVVVFRNPHYGMDRKSEVRSVLSQIVYMLTFTTVNTNLDESGNPKADPLVKRVCGVEGEQLVMQDGTLYYRTRSSDEWKPSEIDRKFAAWNLNAVPDYLKQNNRIQVFPVSSQQYEAMLKVEENRRELNMDAVAGECAEISRRMASYVKNSDNSQVIDSNGIKLFVQANETVKQITACSDGYKWFKNYMTGWIENKDSVMSKLTDDPYAMANYRFNAMYKLYSGRLFLKVAQLYSNGVSESAFRNNEDYIDLFNDYMEVAYYLNILDQRNMPVFPANMEDGTPVYIPEGNYFMMGDNRFNSLDMRHSYSYKQVPLTAYDAYGVQYDSCMEPQYVSKKRILGTASFRFWPLYRMGAIKTK